MALSKTVKSLDDLIFGLENTLGVPHWDFAAALAERQAATKGKGGAKGKQAATAKPKGDAPKAAAQPKADAPKADAPKAEPKPKAEGKKGGGGGGGKAAAAEPDVPDVCRLDMRVGRIIDAQKHPDADSLYLERIDVGEAEPRQVLSGLAGKIPLEEMQNRMVITLCNLKPVAMRGLKSYAMIFCASSDDGTTVQLVEPPAGVAPGEVLSVEGMPALQPDKELNPKKKVFERVQPELLTSDKCIAQYAGKNLMTSKGPCFVKSLTGAKIK